jgi:phi13 family phage major tail protein
MSEGVVIGVRNPYVAIMNNPDTNEKDYAVPVKLAKAVSLKLSPKVNSATLYADDGPAETASVIGEIDVEIETDKLTSDKQALILGNKKDSNGVLISTTDDTPPYLALGFQVPTTGGDKYTWLYKGKFEQMDEDLKTQGEKIDYQTPKVKATFLKRAVDNRWKASVVTGDAGVTQSIIDNWFNAVYDGIADLSALTVTPTPLDKATGILAASDIKFTFNKAIKSDSVNAMNVFLMKSDASTAATTVSVSTDNKTITLHPTTALATGNYIAVCTTGIKDITNLSLVQNSITTFTV